MKARDKKQNKNQAWNPTYPIGLSSTIDPVPRGKVLPHLPQGLEARCVNDFFQYLGMQTGRRNEARWRQNRQETGENPASGEEPSVMTTFDKREEGFEKKFALDEEQKFKAEARRNKLLGLWAADRQGMSAEAASAYARDVVAADFEEAGDGVFRKVTGDLNARGIAVTEEQIRAKMDELLALAIVQVKAGT